MNFKYVTATIEIPIQPKGMRCYGLVHRDNKTIYRNYGRELKNNKGMNFLDIFIKKIEDAPKRLQQTINEGIFG